MNIKISKHGYNEKKLYFETLDLNGILDGTKFELYMKNFIKSAQFYFKKE